MIAAEILKKAKDIISNPKAWTQRALARDKNGRATLALESDAVCFCSSGAVRRAIGNNMDASTPYLRFLDRAAGMEIETFNDHHTHEEVLAVFDEAIELAEKAVAA